MILQKLFCCGDGLFHCDGLDAKRRRRDQATIARARIALKWILNNHVFCSPRTPSPGIRGSPERDNRRSHRSRQVHRAGIVADIKPCAANQFREFGNAEAQTGFEVIACSRATSATEDSSPGPARQD